MYAVAIFLTYNLQFYVPYTLLWPRICRKILSKYGENTINKYEHAFRIGLILITCKFEQFIRCLNQSRNNSSYHRSFNS